MTVSFTANVRPQPQGSIRAFMPKGWKRPVLTSDNPKVKGFRKEVAAAAQEAMLAGTLAMIARPTCVTMRARFFFLKPISAKKRIGHTVKPDLSKLVRAAEDALTGIVYEDDSQIVHIMAAKAYGETERVEITVEAV